MKCPRCGNEWDANKSPCTRCGYVVRLSDQAQPIGRTIGTPVKDVPETPNPFNFTSVPVPGSNMPRPSTSSPFRQPDLKENGFGQSALQADGMGAQTMRPRNAPVRTQPFSQPLPQPGPFTGPLSPPQSPLRPQRPATDPLDGGMQRVKPLSSSIPETPKGSNSPVVDAFPLVPGTLLRGGRYRLQELQGGQEWASGVFEAIWLAQDAQRPGGVVIMYELMLPNSETPAAQSLLRTATMALSSVGRHPHIPALWDAFSDRKRNFFVFEPIEGESLLYRMRRTGRALPEQDMIECCLQMTEILEMLLQQSPSMVHGFIRPENIIINGSGSHYFLTNFSIILAGGGTQYISGLDRSRFTSYTSPEFMRGVADARSDLYSLLATAYHAVTGSVPTPSIQNGAIPPAQKLNLTVSPQFDAILSKGLLSVAGQRYQHPTELRQALLSLRQESTSMAFRGREANVAVQPTVKKTPGVVEQSQQARPATDSVAIALQSLTAVNDLEEEKILLPRPEELSPMEEKNDALYTILWLVVLIISVAVLVWFSQR